MTTHEATGTARVGSAAVAGLPRRIRTRPRPLRRAPKVTVVMPLFNYAGYVGDAIGSALGQVGVEVNVIVIDDGSTDDGLAAVRSLAERDRRIRVVVNERNIGHIPTVNRALKLVDAEYVVKLDADDLLTPGSLARSAALLDAHPSAGFVYGMPLRFNGEPPRPSLRVRSWTVWPGRDWLELGCRRGTNRICQPEVVIRTSTLRAAGPYREELPHTSDFEMWFRLAAISDVGRVNGPHQGWYREHEQSMSRTVNRGGLYDMSERLRTFDQLFDTLGTDDGERLRRTAHRSIAREAVRLSIDWSTRGIAPDGPIEDFIALALHTDPEVASSRQMRTYRRIEHSTPARLRINPVNHMRQWTSNLRWKARWQRWRWSGL